MKQKILLILAATLVLTGCSSSMYEDHKKQYTEETSVQGVSFDILSSVLTSASSVTTISKSVDYGTDTYVYRDGQSTFLMFNMSGIVTVVQKGTTFELQDAENKSEAIMSEGVCGIWFESDGKKLNYEENTENGVYKFFAKVKADVSINPNLYGLFSGYFANLSFDDQEYTMFVGVLGESYSDVQKSEKKVIEHMVKSLKPYEDTQKGVVLGGTSASGNVSGNIIEEDTGVSKSEEDTDKGVTVTELQGAKSGGYSDRYSMLSIGDSGLCDALGSKNAIVEQTITIEKLYVGQEAKEQIRTLCEKEGKEYTDAPAGTSWHLIRYKLKQPLEMCYTDIRIEGFDGNKLVYRGVAHTKRTYDLLGSMTSTIDGYENLYCYYAVPNGCEEYMLSCGILPVVNDIHNACYKVSGFR